MSTWRLKREERALLPFNWKTLKQKWPLLLVILAVAMGGLVFYWVTLRPAPVPALRLTPQNTTATLTVTGQVEAEDQVAISPPITATIETLPVSEGDRVPDGTVLAVLTETPDVVAEARARVRQAQATLQRVQEGARPEERARLQARVAELTATLREIDAQQGRAESQALEAERQLSRVRQAQGALSQQAVTEAETAAQTAREDVRRLEAQRASTQARLNQAREELAQALAGPTAAEIAQERANVTAQQAALARAERTTEERVLRSPFDAIVIERHLSVGDLATPTQPVVTLARTNSLQVEADVEEADLSKLRVGADAFVMLDAQPETPLPAQVTVIGSRVDPENGTFPVTLRLKRPHALMLPGMTADIDIITARLKNALVLPATAVKQAEGQTVVYVFDGDRLKKTPVKVRRLSSEQFQVLSGLTAGQTVARVATGELPLDKRVSTQSD